MSILMNDERCHCVKVTVAAILHLTNLLIYLFIYKSESRFFIFYILVLPERHFVTWSLLFMASYNPVSFSAPGKLLFLPTNDRCAIHNNRSVRPGVRLIRTDPVNTWFSSGTERTDWIELGVSCVLVHSALSMSHLMSS